MSTEIIRKGDTKNSLTRAGDARRTMDVALARLRGREGEISSGRMIGDERPSRELSSYGQTNEDVIDVPRYCAAHGQPYIARYVRVSGHFCYAQSIRYKASLEDQYTSTMTRAALLPSEAFGEETCPWCGATGFGAILCNGCNRFMCWGTTANRYFRCSSLCGRKGYLTDFDVPHLAGLSPGINRRRPSGS
jgi:hypothetical protein